MSTPPAHHSVVIVGGGTAGISVAARLRRAAVIDSWPHITINPTVIEVLGDERYVIFDLPAPPVDTDALQAAHGGTAPSDLALLPGTARARWTIRLPTDSPVTVGEPLSVALDPARLYFFHPDTGAAIH